MPPTSSQHPTKAKLQSLEPVLKSLNANPNLTLLLLLLSRSVLSDSVQPQRRQPTRLPCPWDSPGKNTGVGCHFLLQCMKVKSESEVAQLCPTLSNPMDCSLPGSPIPGIFQARVLEWVAIAFSESDTKRPLTPAHRDTPWSPTVFHVPLKPNLCFCRDVHVIFGVLIPSP